MPYPYLLFDADNTLFDFDQAERNAHLLLCRAHGLAFSEEGYQLYHKCNADLWRDFDRGLCTKEYLLVERFRRYLAITGERADPEALNRDHLRALGEGAMLLPGAEELCRVLSRDHRLLPSHQRRGLRAEGPVRQLRHRPLLSGGVHLRGGGGGQTGPRLL